MVKKIPEETLKNLYSLFAHRSQVYPGNGFSALKSISIELDQKYDIFRFSEKHYVAEQSAHKKRFIELNDYMISLPSSALNEDTVDFSNAHAYRVSDGAEIEISPELGNISTYIGCIVIFECKLFAICKEIPEFFGVVNDKVVRIPASSFEQMVRMLDLSKKHVKLLMRFYPNEGWEIHNGLAINPQTLSVPSILQFNIWHDRCHPKIKKLYNVDYVKMQAILKRNPKKEKPAMKYILNTDK